MVGAQQCLLSESLWGWSEVGGTVIQVSDSCMWLVSAEEYHEEEEEALGTVGGGRLRVGWGASSYLICVGKTAVERK